jgi:hypothetical protein
MVQAVGRRRGRGCKEAESTHHLLRRYRRRVFLILAGPIWDFWLRHCDDCAVVDVEGSGQRGSGRGGGRGLGSRCSSVACAISRAEQGALATSREGQRGESAKAVGGPRVETVVKSTWNSHLPALLHARTALLFRAPKPRRMRGCRGQPWMAGGIALVAVAVAGAAVEHSAPKPSVCCLIAPPCVVVLT